MSSENKTYYSTKDAIDSIAEGDDTSIVYAKDAWNDMKDTPTKRFHTLSSSEAFAQIIIRNYEQHPDFNVEFLAGLYEMIPWDRPSKMFADMDWKLNEFNHDEEQVKAWFLEYTRKVLVSSGLSEEDLTYFDRGHKITNSSRGDKKSLHYLNSYIGFETGEEQLMFWNQVFLLVKEQDHLWFKSETNRYYTSKTFIDFCVYSRDRQMRCIFSPKINGEGKLERPLLPDGGSSRSATKKKIAEAIKRPWLYMITWSKGVKVMASMSKYKGIDSSECRRPLGRIDKQKVDNIVQDRVKNVKVLRVVAKKGTSSETKTCMTLTQEDGFVCKLCGYAKGHCNSYIIVCQKTGDITLRCHSGRAGLIENRIFVGSLENELATKIGSLDQCLESIVKSANRTFGGMIEEYKLKNKKLAKKKQAMVTMPGYEKWSCNMIDLINQSLCLVTGGSKALFHHRALANDFAEEGMEFAKDWVSKDKSNLIIAFDIWNIPTGDARGRVNLIRAWLESSKRRTVQFTICEPISHNIDECVAERDAPKKSSQFLNVYNGLAVTEDMVYSDEDFGKSSDISKLLEFIRGCWCGDDDKIFKYVMDWMAHIVQHPSKKIHVALVLFGLEGAGKTSIMGALGRIVGSRHYAYINSSSSYLGTFNGNLDNKFLVMIDEASWGGDKQGFGKLKSLITEKTLDIEKKHKDRVARKNAMNFVFCSNDEWAVPITANDRRFVHLALDDRALKMSQKEKNEIFNINIHAFARYLYNRDISEFSPQTRPTTKSTRTQKMMNASPIDQWLLDEQEAENSAINIGNLASASDLFESYKRSLDTYSNKRAVKGGLVKFRTDLIATKLFADGGRQRLNGKQPRCLVCPDLASIRKYLSIYTGDIGEEEETDLESEVGSGQSDFTRE